MHDARVAALSSDTLVTTVVMMVGAPPPHPGDVGLQDFANYVHDLALWGKDALNQCLEFWGITMTEYENDKAYRDAYDKCIERWYTLKRED